MIHLSNGHTFEYMIASGAMGFDGRGWFWERPLVALGLMKLELFTIVLRTLTCEPRLYPVSNLSWIRPWTWLPWSPYSCVRFLPNGGAVNKVGLYNHGIEYWYDNIAPTIDFKKNKIVVSVFGTRHELIQMAERLDYLDDIVGIEVNVSCPNTGHAMDVANEVIDSVRLVSQATEHPVIVKVSVDQDYLAISKGLGLCAEAISLNSVPWKIAFPSPWHRSPMAEVGKLGSGDGGVSGKPAQKENWKAVEVLACQGPIPVIGPSVMEYDDLARVRALGAQAVSFGAIHLRTPWMSTQIVAREEYERELLRRPA